MTTIEITKTVKETVNVEFPCYRSTESGAIIYKINSPNEAISVTTLADYKQISESSVNVAFNNPLTITKAEFDAAFSDALNSLIEKQKA